MFRIVQKLLLALIALSLGATVALAADIRSNEDVVNLVKAGFSDAAVIQAIDSGTPKFNMSVNSMIALKKSGVSEAVIQRMMQAGQKRPEESANANPRIGGECISGGEPDGTLVMLDDGQKSFVRGSKGSIETDINALSVLGMGLTFGLVRTQVKALISVRGLKSSLRLKGNAPRFEGIGLTSDLNPEAIALVRLSTSSETRFIQAFEGSFGITGESGQNKFPDQSLIPVEILQTQTGCSFAQGGQTFKLNIFNLKPKSPLPAGEYAVLVFGSDLLFDFGVDK